jgi:MFS family permease
MVLAALVGTGQAFFSPAMTGIVPQVISEAKLQQANALNGLSGSVGGILGPALAGVIIAVSNPGWAVFIDGLTYVVSVVSLYLINIVWLATDGSESFFHQLHDGWREFWSRTWLWVIVVEFSIINILIFATMFVLGPLVAKQSLGGAPAWGLILAFEGAGAVIGGIVMLRYKPSRPLLIATISPIFWVWPLLGLAYRASVLVIAVGALVSGLGVSVFSTLWVTTMQREIPSEILSRVSAYDWFGSLVFLPIGMALIGPVEHVLGLRPTIVGAAVLLVIFIGATLLVPSVVQMRAPVTTSPE